MSKSDRTPGRRRSLKRKRPVESEPDPSNEAEEVLTFNISDARSFQEVCSPCLISSMRPAQRRQKLVRSSASSIRLPVPLELRLPRGGT